LFGDVVERIVVNCGSAKTAPHNFVFLEGVRTAVQAARTSEEGLRAMGRIYAGWALSQTFYRREMWRGLGFTSLEDFLVRSWEASFLRRKASDLMAQLWTWQAGDISANDLYRGDLQMALAGIKAKVLLMPSATDLYFQTDDNRAELPHLRSARLAEIPSVWGHRAGNPAANPEDAAFIDKEVTQFLSS
jgi:homoserine O-acetyltransferase